MLSRPSPLLSLGLVLGLGGALSGCGATGLAWVAESEPSGQSATPVSLARPLSPRESEGSAIPAGAEQQPIAEARPRLSHTVTLGEIDVAPASAAGANGVAGVGAPVTINNYQIVGASGAGFGYASFGYGRSQSSFYAGGGLTRSRSGVAGPQAGQDWPAVADHGSSFPLRSSPASPWARTR